MKLRTLSAALAAAGLLGCASQAAAASGFTLTYQGILSDGSDSTNIFGLGAGADLSGHAITETFVVNYAAGFNDITGGNIGTRDYIGGTGFIASTVTINGVTRSTGSDTGIDSRTDYHIDPNCPGCASNFTVFTEDESTVNSENLHETWTTDALALGRGVDYHPSLAVGPPVFTAADNLEFQGQFLIDHELFNQTLGIPVFEDKTFGVFTPDSVTIATFGVPEPSAWALMLLGFGGAGAALRRRRPATALA